MAQVEQRAAAASSPRGFIAALATDHLSVIAEMKAKSPSGGELSTRYQPGLLAAEYERGGAAAISVLCQGSRFGGHPEHLALARRSCRIPVMRKDFIVEPYQVFEARAHGADALLLIVAALEPAQLDELLALTHRLGMEALVECHTTRELDLALAADVKVIGINHRNLRTLTVDTGLTARLRPRVPADRVLVAESGIRDAAEAKRMRAAGADAVLVGEALMRSSDPAALIREMVREPRLPK
ncbi:MAG: indole-3-glycerol phosphate synthase TrpC [Candidatus Dormibacteraceae bacterium]